VKEALSCPLYLAMTSAVPAVTARDLELEHAELLPARETLWAMVSSHPAAGGDGNTEQAGLIDVAALAPGPALCRLGLLCIA
jgi:hypothetical protein